MNQNHDPRIHTAQSIHKQKRTKWKINPLLLIFVLIIVVTGIWSLLRLDNDIKAVFLTNNQVYFGKFTSHWYSSNAVLTDIYYLQVNEPFSQQEQVNNSDMKVVKLGNELHAPKDKMIIPKSSILFWEEISEEGIVARAIRENQAK